MCVCVSAGKTERESERGWVQSWKEFPKPLAQWHHNFEMASTKVICNTSKQKYDLKKLYKRSSNDAETFSKMTLRTMTLGRRAKCLTNAQKEQKIIPSTECNGLDHFTECYCD